MPHITVEYTANLRPTEDWPKLFAQVHAVLADVGGIKRRNCKSRSVALHDFLVGDGSATAAFVHADVRFLEGRPTELKREIGRRIVHLLREQFPAPPGVRDLQLTVELRDIERSMYFKIPESSLETG